jgi:SAM-dependent methyltransferase
MSHVAALLCCALLLAPQAAPQKKPQKPYEPVVGQPGRDVPWVPNPPLVVEKMLDLAKVGPRDVVIDLGSGDGRNIIAAAKRGATAVGVEFNPDLVELSARRAKEAGVSGRATFVRGDMYLADISKATVMVLFLLPENLSKLRDKLLDLPPGTRLVLNTFAIPDWKPDVTVPITGKCEQWCTAMLYYVPAKVAGTWKTPQGELTLQQTFQDVTGTLNMGGKSVAVTGKLTGAQIALNIGGTERTGKVSGHRIDAKGWSATR